MRQLNIFEFAPVESIQGFRKREVFEAVAELQPTTALELSGYLQRSIHVVMPRLTELRKDGLIEVVGVQHLNSLAYRVYQVISPRGLTNGA